jgi:NADH:ubiquinone oxidoreductase subunit E
MYDSMYPGGTSCYHNSKNKKHERLEQTLRISVGNCEVDVAVRLCSGEGLDLCYIRVLVYRLRGEHALGVVRETS